MPRMALVVAVRRKVKKVSRGSLLVEWVYLYGWHRSQPSEVGVQEFDS